MSIEALVYYTTDWSTESGEPGNLLIVSLSDNFVTCIYFTFGVYCTGKNNK